MQAFLSGKQITYQYRAIFVLCMALLSFSAWSFTSEQKSDAAVIGAEPVSTVPTFSSVTLPAVVMGAAVIGLAAWMFLLRRLAVRRTVFLEEQSFRYRLLFESNADAIMLLNGGRFSDCNPATLSLFGCSTRDDFLNKHPSELSPPSQPDGKNSLQAANEHIATAFQQGKLQFEWVHRKVDGSDFIALVSLNVLPFRAKPELQATVRDITELVQEKKLGKLRQSLMEIILQPENDLHATLAKIVTQVEGLVPGLWCSVLLLNNQGRLRHGAAPNLPEAYCNAIDGVAIGASVGSCGTAAFRAERVIVSDIATDPLWQGYTELAAGYGLAACWSEPIFDEYGKVLGTFAMYYGQPRSPLPFELKVIQMAGELASLAILREKSEAEKAQAFAIIESSSDFVGLADSKGRILYVNPAGRSMIGLDSNADVAVMSLADICARADAECLMSVGIPQLSAEGVYRAKVNFVHDNGEDIPTKAIFCVQKYSDGSPESFSIIAHDIRQELQQQERIAHTQRLESLGVLAGGIAHDFNNILAAIIGNAEMAGAKCVAHPQELPKHLANIIDSSEKAVELCKQMLVYAGKGQVVVAPLNLSQMVKETGKLLGVSITKSVILKYHLTEPLPAVDADLAQMQQVMMNMVINASEAIGEHNGIISIDTGLIQADRRYLQGACLDDELPEGKYVFLEVSDTGCGMDQATQQRIFEPFFTTKFIGRGLGMSAVLGIIRSHHGTLMLDSEFGRGSTFRMLLPASSHVTEV
jgi:PAS domain S-box-containing protein